MELKKLKRQNKKNFSFSKHLKIAKPCFKGSTKKNSNKHILSIFKIFKNPFHVDTPKTAQQFAQTLFKDIDKKTDIYRIDNNHYSFCLEYTDISFSKAAQEKQVDIFTTWVDYLNSYTEKTHIQVINMGKSRKTKDYKKAFLFDENNKIHELSVVASEFNKLINSTIGYAENILETKRYIVVSQKANSAEEAYESFMDIFNKTEDKFKNIKSNIRIVPYQERLNMIYDLLNIDTAADHDFINLLQKAENENKTIYDVLVPQDKNAISFKERNYINIMDKKYLQILYVSKYPKTLTPRFYNAITTQDMNIITTLNISPTNSAKIKNKISKKISGMETEKYDKIKRLAKSNVNYHDAPDRKLEHKIQDAVQLEEDIRKKKQKIFKNNILICIIAESIEEMDKNRSILTEIAAEHFIELKPILWQQLEGLKHILPLGHDSIQFQRSLTSEAVAINVPFHSKDLMQRTGLYHGLNQSTRKCLFADRKNLMNGNGCVLATSGAGKSFEMKSEINQIKLKYPDDDIIIIAPQKEYDKIIDAGKGQTITISANSKTYINPFDLDMNYSLSEDESDPVKEKIEYILSFVESLMDTPLTGIDKTLIDRCCKILYGPYVKSNYTDEELIPDLPLFYRCMLAQPETAAQEIAVVLERYVNGSIDMFSKPTNIDINNNLICFDISNLSQSMQTTGYLVVLDYIMNSLAKNKEAGKSTWIFIDEFHILLRNEYSAEYISKIYKIGRKLHALPTICTQNIANVLKSDYGCDILSNSEFAILLKQKTLDLQILSKIFDISEEEQSYITNSPSGHGLMIYGEDCYPFKNVIPKDYFIYELNETSSLQKARI